MSEYPDGSRANPVLVWELGEACDVAVERDRPVYALLEESGDIVKVFPSRHYEDVHIAKGK